MKNSKGFATLLLLSLLPLILAGGLLVFCGFAFLKTDLGLLNLCRAQQLQTQNKVAKNLEALLKMNPKALKLRLAQKRAEHALAMAVQSGNPIAVAAAEAFLLKIQLQRQALDLRQRTLIQSANTILKAGGRELPQQLSKEWNSQIRPLSSWLAGSLHPAIPKVPEFAVQADFFDIAPLYEPVTDFEEAQSWNQTWQLEFKTISWAQKFLTFHGRFQRSCSTSLYSEEASWIAKLKKAKSSWRVFS